MRALVVDDEVLSRVALRQALASHPDVEIVGECGHGDEVIAALPLLRPDLLFLDVQMPGMGGFALLETLRRTTDALPLVVFVTAYDRHALRAFEAQAMDYLLKPLDQTRVDQALEKVRAQARGRAAGAPSARVSGEYLDRVSVRDGERIHLLRTTEIDWVEADGNYVTLHAGQASHLHRETLSGLETRLDPRQFLRIHRGILVNLDRVKEIRPLFHGGAHVLLHDGTKLTLSRRYRDKAKALLEL
jgi:two-component system LytT family response regulator